MSDSPSFMHLQKNIRRLLLTILAGVLLLIIAAHFASRYVEKKARDILASIPLNVSTVDADFITRSIELSDVEWTKQNDSLPSYPHHLYINKVRLEGIGVYQLLANRKLNIGRVVIEVGEFQLNRNLKATDRDVKKRNVELSSVTVDQIDVRNIYTKIATDSIDQYEGLVSASLEDIFLDDLDKVLELTAYDVKSFNASLRHIKIMGDEQLYSTTVSRVHVNSEDRKIEIDSVLLTPLLSKYRFSRKVGRQIDRINLFIPSIEINDFSFSELKDSLVRAAFIDIKSANVHVFRDKRLPFIKKKNTPLPIAMIRDFKFGLAIDTLRIKDANITYEEFPEDGFHSGKVTFEKLNAKLDHLSNREHYPEYKQATLAVTSYLMGKGLIKVEFSLPYGKDQVYNAKGSLNSLALHRLNPILENVAFMSVTSGKLNQLTFNFDYTDHKATGSVLVNYEDLKVNTLTKEKNPEKNEVKTLVVNTILKKDKDEKVDKEKRTGVIEFERHRKRAIFHYWWRALLTGIKSSMVESPAKKEKKRKKDS